MYTAAQLAKKYAAWYLKASSGKGHGVHSPFVFEFIKFIKNNKETDPRWKEIERLRKDLLRNDDSIIVNDPGAGSSVISTEKRMVRRMAASSLKPEKFARLFARMVTTYQPATIVELGTSFGISTAYMAMAAGDGRVHTIEGVPAIRDIALKNFAALGLENIESLQGNFDDTFEPLLLRLKKTDLLYIDGNHRYKPTINYFRTALPYMHNHSIIIFDDIHWSREMEQAWEEIKNAPEVTLSIDLFFVGIVFFRKEFKIKQHFSIRF